MAGFSFLKLTENQRWAIIYLAAGYDQETIASKIYNQRTGELGIETTSLRDWKYNHPAFKEAWEATIADPMWAQTNISAPMFLNLLTMRELEYVGEKNGQKFKGMSPKKLELLLIQNKLLDRPDETNRQLMIDILANSRLVPNMPQPQLTIIDVVPTVTQEN